MIEARRLAGGRLLGRHLAAQCAGRSTGLGPAASGGAYGIVAHGEPYALHGLVVALWCVVVIDTSSCMGNPGGSLDVKEVP